MTNNASVLKWIDEMKALVTPDQMVWIDGSEGQLRALREQAFATGELEERGESLMDFVKSSLHYRGDRVLETLEGLDDGEEE